MSFYLNYDQNGSLPYTASSNPFIVSLSLTQKSSMLTFSPAKNLPKYSFEMHSVKALFASLSYCLYSDELTCFFSLKFIALFYKYITYNYKLKMFTKLLI